MSTAQLEPISFETLLNHVPELTVSQLDQLFNQMAVAKAHKLAPSVKQAEAELYKKIYAISVPETLQARCRVLTEKQKTVQLSLEERAEMIEIVNQVENYGVERLKLLIELAALQQVDLPTLIKQIELAPLSYE